MITIDGSLGEGGGQILRTALTLSAIFKTPITINNIRRGRKKPGLQIQHLTSARAIAEITRGKLAGDQLFSDSLIFEPGEAVSGSYEFDVARVGPSAGSVSLIFAQILPALLFTGEASYVTLKGGTDVDFSPPVDFLKFVFLPALQKTGINASLEILKRGFYPIGGGEIKTTIQPLKNKIKNMEIMERGKLKQIEGLACVANLPASLADREIKQAQKMLESAKLPCRFKKEESSSKSSGNIFFLSAEYENLAAGFSRLGELGKSAERVAGEAVTDFINFNSGSTAAEKHLADQLILYLALAEGRSSISVELLTPHLKTNIEVVEQFLPVKFEVNGNIISVEGTGKAPK